MRFESVNYRSRVWLNGRRVGTNRGAYIPFEFRLNGLKRRGTNRLVIRVDSKRRSTDFPPSGLSTDGVPTGGWWNYSGLQREVYLKRLNVVDWKSVRVIPRLACASCTARRCRCARSCATSRGSGQGVRITGNFGSRRLNLGSRSVSRNGVASFSHHVQDAQPARVVARAAQPLQRQPARERRRPDGRQLPPASTGIRSIRVSGDGRLILNGQRVNLRGVGVHEDSKRAGLRGRQRVPPAPRRRDQGGRRDADAHPLPDASLHARARRPRGRDDLVRGPGLRDQDGEPRARTS